MGWAVSLGRSILVRSQRCIQDHVLMCALVVKLGTTTIRVAGGQRLLDGAIQQVGPVLLAIEVGESRKEPIHACLLC